MTKKEKNILFALAHHANECIHLWDEKSNPQMHSNAVSESIATDAVLIAFKLFDEFYNTPRNERENNYKNVFKTLYK